jgi:hypothetical protein
MNNDVYMQLMVVRAGLIGLEQLLDKQAAEKIAPAVRKLSDQVNTIQNEFMFSLPDEKLVNEHNED